MTTKSDYDLEIRPRVVSTKHEILHLLRGLKPIERLYILAPLVNVALDKTAKKIKEREEKISYTLRRKPKSKKKPFELPTPSQRKKK